MQERYDDREVAAALFRLPQEEGWRLVARALEAAARCPDYAAHGVLNRATDCAVCCGTCVDPARLAAGLKRLEGG